MARHLGKEGSITADGVVVGEIVSFNFTERTSLVVDTPLGSDWERHSNGMKSWDGSITAMIDPSDAAQEAMSNGASVDLVMFTQGTASGAQRHSGTVTIEEIAVTIGGNDTTTERGFTFKGSGAKTIDTVP